MQPKTLYTHTCIHNVFGRNAPQEKKRKKGCVTTKDIIHTYTVYIMSLVATQLKKEKKKGGVATQFFPQAVFPT